MQGTKKVAIPDNLMSSIMKIALDKKSYPLLIHCNHGKVIKHPSWPIFTDADIQ
jgi:hypothetical protein